MLKSSGMDSEDDAATRLSNLEYCWSTAGVLLVQRRGVTSQRNLTISSGLLKGEISDKIGLRHRHLPQCGTDMLAARAGPNNFACTNSYYFRQRAVVQIK